MKSIVTIKDKHIEIEMDGLRMLYPLENVIVLTDGGSVRGDVMLELYTHASNQISYGGCPKECEVCKAHTVGVKQLADKMKA